MSDLRLHAADRSRGAGHPNGIVSMDLGTSHLGFGHDPAIDLEAAQRIAVWVYAVDCDAVVEAVGGSGGTVLAEPADQPWGERMAIVTDPDGTG